MQKKQSTVSQRSFGVGTVAECMEALGPCSARFVGELLPLILQMSQDEHEEVRNNAIFGLGELVLYAKDATYPYPFLQFLPHFSLILSESQALSWLSWSKGIEYCSDVF